MLRELAPLEALGIRAVEAQHLVSTRKLVDSDAAQRVLEELLEAHKPPPPAEAANLHYLLFTPFRYPPLRYGSRFGQRHQRGLFYASLRPETCLAEVAYYRLLFLAGSAAKLEPLEVDLTLFRARVRTERGVDLGSGAFRHWRAPLRSPSDYAFTQALGGRMREEGVEAFLFASARDPEAGSNLAVFAPSAFGRSRPHGMQTWHAFATHAGVEMRRQDFFRVEVLAFPRALFEVEGALPMPAS
ncbi:MAG: RES family NAD+ phosphorylase [Deltaproteobacteria bacterium]|nr:RES family NAD+ phosphorylase [Deltaproteobacteria bacterium]